MPRGTGMRRHGATSTPFGIAIDEARVIEPESKLDAIRHIGIRGLRFAAVPPPRSPASAPWPPADSFSPPVSSALAKMLERRWERRCDVGNGTILRL